MTEKISYARVALKMAGIIRIFFKICFHNFKRMLPFYLFI